MIYVRNRKWLLQYQREECKDMTYMNKPPTITNLFEYFMPRFKKYAVIIVLALTELLEESIVLALEYFFKL